MSRVAILAAALFAATMPVSALAQSAFTTTTLYDVAGRVTGTIAPDPDGAGPINYAAVRNSYDAAGRLTKVEKGELAAWQSEAIAPADWASFTTFAVFQTMDVAYDTMGQKIKVTMSSGGVAYGVTQYSYDQLGHLVCTAVRMNPAAYGSLPADACTLGTAGVQGPDRITKTVYDPLGDVLAVQKAVGVTVANGFPATLQQDYATYSYTGNGKPAAMFDANGNKASYTYDGFDRLAQWNFPDKTNVGAVSGSDYEAYTYDANANRTSLRKRDGRTFTYSYDALNRVTVKSVPGACITGYACTTPPASAVRDVYYGYDLRGLQTYARFDSASGVDRVDNVYDGFGRVSSQTSAMFGVSRTVSYLYDADGNRIRITHPDGAYFTTDYDGLDRAVVIKENGSATIATMAYDAQGREASETRGAVTTTFGYDPVSRLSSLADDLPGGATNDITTTFDYNPASQLVGRMRSNPAPYAFDGYVNVSRPYTTNGLNQYGSAGSATFGYDANGNLVSDGTTSYTYDAENRLVMTDFAGGTTLIYDPLGRFYSALSSGAKSIAYDGDQRIVEYTGSATVIARRFVLGPGGDNPLLYYEGSGLSDRRALQADERGSITSVVDASGALLGINSYDEYGIRGGAKFARFGYTGQVWIDQVGMWYYKARFYSPTLGRFMQTDPIGYADQNNLYAYVANDPIDGKDPTGLEGDPGPGPGIGHNSASFGEMLEDAAEAIPEAVETIGGEAVAGPLAVLGGIFWSTPTSEANGRNNFTPPARSNSSQPATAKPAVPGPLKQSTPVGARVRTPANSPGSFTRLKSGQGSVDKKTGTIFQKGNTNHSKSPGGEYKAGVRPGVPPTPGSKVTISGGPKGGCVLKKDGC